MQRSALRSCAPPPRRTRRTGARRLPRLLQMSPSSRPRRSTSARHRMIPQPRSARCAPAWRTPRSALTRCAPPPGSSASRSSASRLAGMRPARSPRDTSIKATRSGWHSTEARPRPSSESEFFEGRLASRAGGARTAGLGIRDSTTRVHVACASGCMSIRTSLEEGIKLHRFAAIFPEQFLTEAGGHRKAVMAADQRMVVSCCAMISPASLTIFLIWRLPIQRADLYPALGKRDVLETGNSAKGSKLYLHAKPLVVNRGRLSWFQCCVRSEDNDEHRVDAFWLFAARLAKVDQLLRKAPAALDASGTSGDLNIFGNVSSWIASLSASMSNGLRSILKFEGAASAAAL